MTEQTGAAAERRSRGDTDMIRKLAIPFALAASLAMIAPAALAADAAAGKASYDANCASCHGPEGKGDGPVAAALTNKPRDFSVGDFKYDTDGDGTSGTDTDLTQIVKQGAAAFGGDPMMAPLGHLSDEEIANILAFVRSLKK